MLIRITCHYKKKKKNCYLGKLYLVLDDTTLIHPYIQLYKNFLKQAALYGTLAHQPSWSELHVRHLKKSFCFQMLAFLLVLSP